MSDPSQLFCTERGFDYALRQAQDTTRVNPWLNSGGGVTKSAAAHGHTVRAAVPYQPWCKFVLWLLKSVPKAAEYATAKPRLRAGGRRSCGVVCGRHLLGNPCLRQALVQHKIDPLAGQRLAARIDEKRLRVHYLLRHFGARLEIRLQRIQRQIMHRYHACL